MNALKKLLFLSLSTLILISPAPAISQNKVIPIDSSGIKELMNGKGCPLLIVATAAWCAPCREELPILNEMYLKYKDQGLKLVAISLDITASDMQRIVNKLDIKFPVYWGGDKMAFEYSVFGVPTILVMQDGQVKERIIGKRSEKFLEEKISRLVEACIP
ncbi:MAG: TlpA family protein disulfide reductase [Deltaproteobacteria bacterium]|nr:TlpA family protein disulfide reductase [Deltaproteobacteria bacterium]